MSDDRRFRVAIVGAGFSGLGMAIRLKQEGIEDFVVFERRDDVGGTWNDNTYPGCACDVPSHLYSFSFAPNPDWSRTYSPQAEIWDYLRGCVRRFGIGPHIRFGIEVEEAAWDEDEQRWAIRTPDGVYTAQVLVAAPGPLSEPKLPEVPGLEDFEGKWFHSAAWDHDHDLTGERVAAVGTGASAIQFIPEIQPRVAKLNLFQRTPPWIMPHTDRPITELERRVYRRSRLAQTAVRAGIYLSREAAVPGLMGNDRMLSLIERRGRWHLRRQVPDPALRAKLEPSYRIGCKRILLSNDYYPALTQPNVEVITCGMREIRAGSVVGADGVEREVDTIIFGTGFYVTEIPVSKRVRGRGGLLLADRWSEGAEAYKGTTIAGFPNLFMLVGPNTGLGHNSIVYMIESQLEYVLDGLRFMERRGIASVDVRPEAQEAFNRQVQRDLEGSVWSTGGCKSWYLDARGRNTTLWPGHTWRYRRGLREFDPQRYALGPAARERVAVAA